MIELTNRHSVPFPMHGMQAYLYATAVKSVTFVPFPFPFFRRAARLQGLERA